MNMHLVASLGLLGFTAIGAYAAVPDAPAAPEQAIPAAPLAEDRYVSARRDAGGGYLLQELGLDDLPHRVAALDLASAGLDAAATRAVDEAPSGDLVLYGSFVPSGPDPETEGFAVKAAFRGLPGMVPEAADGFFVLQEPDAVACGAAPDGDEVAVRLGTGDTSEVTSVSVARAAAPRVDPAWLASRVRRHGAVVAGRLQDGVLDASQIFVRLPDPVGPCLLIRHDCRAPLHAAYVRDPNRCVTFDRCLAARPCSFVRPGPCADGYVQVSWAADTAQCLAFACDPAFLSE